MFVRDEVLNTETVLQLAVSSHENATPVKLVHNAAGHLIGPARSIGAAVIGYLGTIFSSVSLRVIQLCYFDKVLIIRNVALPVLPL